MNSIKTGKFIDLVSDFRLLKEVCGLWNQLTESVFLLKEKKYFPSSKNVLYKYIFLVRHLSIVGLVKCFCLVQFVLC